MDRMLIIKTKKLIVVCVLFSIIFWFTICKLNVIGFAENDSNNDDSFSLEAGSYYIGCIDASTNNDMNYDIMRIVVDQKRTQSFWIEFFVFI